MLYHGHTVSIYIKNPFKRTLFWFLKIHCYVDQQIIIVVYTRMRSIKQKNILIFFSHKYNINVKR